jgi:hypothetical protein
MRLFKRAWLWFDDLTGVSKLVGPLLDHPVPKARKSAWFPSGGSYEAFTISAPRQ